MKINVKLANLDIQMKHGFLKLYVLPGEDMTQHDTTRCDIPCEKVLHYQKLTYLMLVVVSKSLL